MEAIYHSGSGGRETGVIFLHGFQINEVDRKWMATFGSERPMTARQWGTHSQGPQTPTPGYCPLQRVGGSLG